MELNTLFLAQGWETAELLLSLFGLRQSAKTPQNYIKEAPEQSSQYRRIPLKSKDLYGFALAQFRANP
jgi:hypothetical protein